MTMREIPDSHWSLETSALADLLATALEQAALEPEGPTPWLQFWAKGLETPATRTAARLLATELAARTKAGTWTSRTLRVQATVVSWADQEQKLMLLLTQTIFEPEDWSRTFLEGLLRRPPAAWRGAQVVEVGTGSGWISIALCLFTDLDRILALDLNPEAVAVARINSWLNGLADDGSPLPSSHPLPLWERMSCAESDLLRTALDRGVRIDALIGCIPQVLQSQVLQPADAARSRSEALTDLSNYCALQGLVEDRFGLGLNAAAIDQGLECLTEGGVIILNLAGRPGQTAVTRMFTRRGLKPRTLWRTRISQAADTAIDSLVSLEAETAQDFEFFLHRQSPRSIPARTAKEVVHRGRPVWHELQVVEAYPALGELTGKLVHQLRALGMGDAMREIDLEPVDEEQARFVLSLAEELDEHPVAPYPHEAGDAVFREKVAAYLERYTGRALEAQGLFIGPGRASTYHVLGLALSHPKHRWLVNHALHDRLLPVAKRLDVTLLPAPDSLRELGELMELLEPDLVLVAMREGELDALGEVGGLVTRAVQKGIPLIIDDTQGFEITSRATGGGVVGALAEHPHGHAPIFVIGLERSKVYPGLSVTLVVHPDRGLHARLEAAAESTYSRIGWFQQRYFEGLFGEMTTFRMWGTSRRRENVGTRWLAALPEGRIVSTLTLPAFARPAPGPEILRLDYGENEGALPPRLIHSLVAGFLEQSAGAPDPVEEQRLETLVAHFLIQTRGILKPPAVVIEHGVWPALFAAIEAVQTMRGGRLRVAVAPGHYGMLEPLLTVLGAELVRVPAGPEHLFRLRPSALDLVGPVDLLWLNQPTNPTGVSYSQGELDALVEWAEGRGVWLFCDEIFGLLRVAGTGSGRRVASPLASPGSSHQTVVFGGLSKEFAAGGLRLGWLASANVRLVEAVRALRLDPVPRFALQAGRALLDACLRELGSWDSPLDRYLREQAQWLSQNLALAREGLEPLGIRIPEAESVWGLSCLLDLRGITDDAEAWVLKLEQEKGVRLNTPSWSETPGFARMCLSVPEARMLEAVARIREWMGKGGG